MWVITRIQMHVSVSGDDRFEQAVADLVTAEAAGCDCCGKVLEATGALPTHCYLCGAVRNTAWQEEIDERASRELAYSTSKQCKEVS